MAGKTLRLIDIVNIGALFVVAVFASADSAGVLMKFMQFQAKRFGITVDESCYDALKAAGGADATKEGMSKTSQIALAVTVLVVLLVLLKFVKFLIKIVVGHALAVALLYVLARYVPFMRRYFIKLLSSKAA